MTAEDFIELERLLNLIKSDTEEYVNHENMIVESDKYAVIIAISKYLERFKY